MANPRTRSRKPDDKYLFGTPEEIANRGQNPGLFAGHNPVDNAPHFVQIPPSSGGGSVNRAPIGAKSGNIKFSGGV